MIGVKYIGPVFDFSGYGEAARNYIFALDRAGVPVTVLPHCFDRNPPAIGSNSEREHLKSLVDKPIDFDVVIVHLTPDLVPHYRELYRDKYLISYTVWETSKIHPLWVSCCNAADEVWVPSYWNVQAFKESGVTVPIRRVPHGIDVSMFDKSNMSNFAAEKDDIFTFYSIFQWNTRKNPQGLLRAYFNAFKGHEDVRLIIKAYIGGGLAPATDAARVREEILSIKRDMGLEHFPKVRLCSEQLTTEQVRGLHLYGDAYVSLPRGEGWGLTMFEAGLAGKPVIGTGGGGNLDFMTPNNSYLVNARWTYVSGMGGFNPWYHGDQLWFDPDLLHAAERMREVYSNRAEAKERGLLLKKDIVENFNWDKVASYMVERLKEI